MMTVWGLAAALIAVLAEVLYRKMPDTSALAWLELVWLWIPLQLAIGFCVFRLLTSPGTTLLNAFVVFAFSTAFVRLLVSLFVLNEEVTRGAWAAFALLIVARFVQHYWR
jgi:drug/metabolite transporter (DMT)-like permease